MFAGKKSAQIREILISESAWEEMTCLFAPSLGYSHRMYEKTGDRQLCAWEAGILTRRYGLDKEMVMDFFRENNSCSTLRFFMAGYRLEN